MVLREAPAARRRPDPTRRARSGPRPPAPPAAAAGGRRRAVNVAVNRGSPPVRPAAGRQSRSSRRVPGRGRLPGPGTRTERPRRHRDLVGETECAAMPACGSVLIARRDSPLGDRLCCALHGLRPARAPSPAGVAAARRRRQSLRVRRRRPRRRDPARRPGSSGRSEAASTSSNRTSDKGDHGRGDVEEERVEVEAERADASTSRLHVVAAGSTRGFGAVACGPPRRVPPSASPPPRGGHPRAGHPRAGHRWIHRERRTGREWSAEMSTWPCRGWGASMPYPTGNGPRFRSRASAGAEGAPTAGCAGRGGHRGRLGAVRRHD